MVEKDSLKKSFTGKLNLSEIQQIKATQTDWGKTILLTGVGTALLVTFLAFWNKQDDGLRNEVVIKYPSGGGCGRLSNNFHPYNENKLSAAGLKNMIDINSLNPDKVMYLDIVKGNGTFHFKVDDDVSQIEIEMVDEFPSDVNNSNVLTIELSK